MSKIQKWVVGIVGGLIVVLLVALVVMGFMPVPADVAPKPAESLIGAPADAPTTRPVESSQTYTVQPGDSIQAAVDKSKPGDTIEIMAGTYHEAVQVKTHNITVRGVPDASGQLPLLDGENKLDNGFKVTGSFFTIEKLDIRNYTENGVIAQGTYGPIFRDLVVDNTGRYAVFPIASTNVLIEGVTASGIADSALYVGQSKDIIVRNSEAFKSVTGIEIENSDNALVENNYVHDNTGGILVFVSPHLNSKEGHDNIVRNNKIENNNLPNFASGGLVQKVPPGLGMLILVSDNTEVSGNTISGNNSAGIAIVEAKTFEDDISDYDIPLVPEGTWVHGNTFTNNGTQLSESAAKYGLPGGNDILWDASGWNNTFDQPGAHVFPYAPSPAWPDFVKRIVWRAIQVLK
jgi:cytochrome c peroxidase